MHTFNEFTNVQLFCDCCNKEIKDHLTVKHLEQYPFNGFYVCSNCDQKYKTDDLYEKVMENQKNNNDDKLLANLMHKLLSL